MRPLFVLYIVIVGVATRVCGLMGMTVTITSNDTLLDLLCGSRGPSSNTTYELTSSQPYIIPQGDFCTIENVNNVTFLGNSVTKSLAVIKCSSNETSSLSRGFAFINAHSLTLANIVLEGCGAVMTEKVLERGKSSVLYFDQGEAAVLVCNTCCDLTLSLVHIKRYTGRAIVGIDIVGEPILDSVIISDNTDVHQNCNHGFSTCKGSGIVWMYTDTTNDTLCAKETVVTITDSEFSNNTGFVTKATDIVRCTDNLADSFYVRNSSFEPVSVPSVGAMTLIHQQYFSVKINIIDSNFTGNRGLCFGAVLVIQLSETAQTSLKFSGCIFSNNSQIISNRRFQIGQSGFTITVYMKYLGNYSQNFDCLNIGNSHFAIDSEDEDSFMTSQILLVQFPDSNGYCLATLHNVSGGNIRLLYALSLDAGDSLDVTLSKINLTGITFNDSPTLEDGDGLLTFSSVNRVHIADSVFNQLTGPIIYGEASYIMFSGNVVFGSATGSSWTSGAAMYLRGESIIWLIEPLNLTFYNNTALLGGAIYSISRFAQYCAVQFITDKVYSQKNIGDININVTFKSNSARLAGNSMYIKPLNMCSLRLSTTVRGLKPSTVYNKVFKFEEPVENGLLEISSSPIQICLCGDDLNNTNLSALKCSEDTIPTVRTFPGKTFSLSAVPIDESFNRVYSLVYSNPRQEIEPGTNTSALDWHLGYGEDTVQAYGYNCTTFSFTIFTGNVGDAANGTIALFPSGSVDGLSIPVRVFNCPPGFELDEGTDSCGCLNFLENKDIQCNASSELITRPGTSWIGIIRFLDENITRLTAEDIDMGYSNHCPTRYCNQSSSLISVSEDSLCLHGRTGVLCGQCKAGLSVTVGSPECHSCTNWWLLTTLPYALLGVGIVALLLILQLTVTQGTINGLIFYANILSISTYYLFGFKETKPSLIFVSLLNLEFGFAVCLYDGLDDITKAILSILFPMYIWLIAIALVYASRYSYKLSQLTSQSAVPVLATLVYITYYKLLRFSVDGLAFATIQIQPRPSRPNDTIVWYYDGSIHYLSNSKHIGLFVMVLVVVCAFILPYGILLTGIQFFNRFRIINKFKPLIDAYCAPYKDRYRYWFGLRLWVLLVVYILFAGLRNTPQILFLCQSIILILFIIAQVAVMPFKSIIINWLDLFYMINALLLSIVALQSSPLGVLIAANLSVVLALVVFCCIVGYHTWNLWKQLRVLYKEWKARRYALLDKVEPTKKEITQTSLVISDSTEGLTTDGLHYQGFVSIHPSRFRDSILEESVADT